MLIRPGPAIPRYKEDPPGLRQGLFTATQQPDTAITLRERDDGTLRACVSRGGLIVAAVAEGAVPAVLTLARKALFTSQG